MGTTAAWRQFIWFIGKIPRTWWIWKEKFQIRGCNKLNSSLGRLIGAFSESYILEFPPANDNDNENRTSNFQCCVHLQQKLSSWSKMKQLSSSYIHKREADHNWHTNTSWILLNPAEIESFLKTGADLIVSVLSHVCGSRFREITLCALKVSVLSQALAQWSLDRICFA